MATKVLMPEMGEGVDEATIIRWVKQEGEIISQFDPLVEVNTDKVDSEIPAPISGTILKIIKTPYIFFYVNGLYVPYLLHLI